MTLRQQVALINLDDHYVPRGNVTVIETLHVGHNLDLIEDVHLFTYRGELQMLFVGLSRRVNPDGTKVRSFTMIC